MNIYVAYLPFEIWNTIVLITYYYSKLNKLVDGRNKFKDKSKFSCMCIQLLDRNIHVANKMHHFYTALTFIEKVIFLGIIIIPQVFNNCCMPADDRPIKHNRLHSKNNFTTIMFLNIGNNFMFTLS